MYEYVLRRLQMGPANRGICLQEPEKWKPLRDEGTNPAMMLLKPKRRMRGQTVNIASRHHGTDHEVATMMILEQIDKKRTRVSMRCQFSRIVMVPISGRHSFRGYQILIVTINDSLNTEIMLFYSVR